MKHMTTIILAGITLSFSLTATAEGIIGTFKGEENVVMSDCKDSNINGSSTGAWEVTHKSTGESSYKGKGKTPSGKFKSKGEVSGNSASGSVTGTNKWGAKWDAEFTSELDGDSLKVNATGNIPSWGCNFTSNVQATRQ